MMKAIINTILTLSTLTALTAQANMAVSFHDNTQLKNITLNGIAAGINGMGSWTPLNGRTFSVNQAPGKNIPINTVVNAMFDKSGYVPAAGNAIIGWDAASSQFNYGWGDNTAYKVGKLCMDITVDEAKLPQICTNNSASGNMTSAPVKYNSNSKVTVTFSRG